MFKNESIKKLRGLLSKYVIEDEAIETFDKILKEMDKEVKALEYKLKLTVRDRQITHNILNTTIDDLKEKTVAIENQKDQLEEQTKFKETLFANVSHELRTPLHGIQGMNQLLSKTDLNKVQTEYVDIVRSSADNLLVIINDLLTFSQMNAGKVRLKNKPFSMESLCLELENILSLKAQKKGLTLMCMCPTNLPEFLIGDRIRLYQLFINLLNNAIKFTHRGGIVLNIYPIEIGLEKVKLQFEIRDTGIGMKQEQLGKIFSSFTRVHDEDGIVYEGAGLGLNIVKKLVNLMGGTIEVKSEFGKGTSFYVNFDFDIASKSEVEIFKKKKDVLPIPAHWRYKKFLMIEDNQANLLYARNMFLDWGIKLTIAESLLDAKKQLASERFDCILSDVKLPDGNGLEFIKALRANTSQQNQNTPVIVLTASSSPKEAAYSKKINIESYIGKPFRHDLLLEELTKVLDEPKASNEQASFLVQKKSKNNSEYFANLDRNFKHKNHLKVEIINIFLDQIPKVLQKLEQAIAINDIEAFHFSAHSIKSTICNIGLPKLQPLVTKMDDYCYRKINLDQLPDLFEKFKQVVIEDIQIMLKEKERLMAPHE